MKTLKYFIISILVLMNISAHASGAGNMFVNNPLSQTMPWKVVGGNAALNLEPTDPLPANSTSNHFAIYGITPHGPAWSTIDFGPHPGSTGDCDVEVIDGYNGVLNFENADGSNGFKCELNNNVLTIYSVSLNK